uniref:Kallikrein related peptidase 7 n=1 Tax=Molossus molossus TaxID=27622 RepID=A0A7J8C864_MOLMO|nr:kallikrein related peptidase 7 [Molossus molossus]
MAGPLFLPLLTLLLALALGSAGQEIQGAEVMIMNGVPCPRGCHPWQVALFKNSVFQCAGVPVNEQWVTTIAYSYMRPETYMILLANKFN